MVAKSKQSASRKAAKKSRVKISKLRVDKETVKDLSGKEAKNVRGGEGLQIVRASRSC